MIDAHNAESWGMAPVLGHIGALAIPAYETFVLLAVVAAMLVYAYGVRRHPLGENSIYLLLAALIGGTLGAKIPVWVTHFREIVAALPDVTPLLSGRTVVGGLIGGVLAVDLTKKRLGIAGRTGNLFAPALALGIAIGRIGCLLRGCCYGMPTSLPGGIDLGDGILRYPVQIYESLFAFALFAVLLALRKRVTGDGMLFALFMLAYFSFRFCMEFLRVEPRPYAGFTLAQVVAAGVIAYYGIMLWQHKSGGHQDERSATR